MQKNRTAQLFVVCVCVCVRACVRACVYVQFVKCRECVDGLMHRHISVIDVVR
jgi:hypothetical protein